MKHFQSTLKALFVVAAISNIAGAQTFHWFTTTQEAGLHCPSPSDGLVYKGGSVTGISNATGKSFSSSTNSAKPPVSTTSKGAIGDAQFRNAGFGYGYTSGSRTVCLYTYPAHTSPTVVIDYALQMNSL